MSPALEPSDHNEGLSVSILAGGSSSRMGTNKALLRLGHRSCIEIVLAVAAQVSSNVAIVSSNPQPYEFLNCPIIPDRYPGKGPLGGVHAALHHSRSNWVLVLGCDLPFITIELVNVLVSRSNRVDAVVPQSEDGRLQPLCALYARTCLAEVVNMIESGVTSLQGIFPRVRTQVVGWDEIGSLAGAELFFFDLDTPEDARQAHEFFLNRS